MKKITLFLSVLLMAMVVKAQDAEYGVVWAQDFEDEATYTDGWTLNGSKHNTFNGSKYLHLYGVNASISFANNSSFTAADDYKFEFDWNAGQGNGNAKVFTMTVMSDNTEGKLCYVNVGASSGWSSAAVACDAAGNSLVETTVDGYRKDAAFSFMFHFLIEGNSDGVHLTITKNDGTSVLEKTKISESLYHVTGLSATYSSASCMGFDNISLSVLGASEGISAPSLSITGTYGMTRTVSIVKGVGTEGTEAAATYYTTDGTEPTKENGTEYTEPFTVSESCTIKAVSYLPDGTASEVATFEAEAGTVWPLNADVIKVSGLVGEGDIKNPVITNSYVNTGVLGNPEVSFSYTFNGETVTLPYTITEDGTLVATAEADGYASATETLEMKASYVETRSVDLKSMEITEENIAEELGESWTYHENTRWASWNSNYTYPNACLAAGYTFGGVLVGSGSTNINLRLLIGYGVGKVTSNATTYTIANPTENEIALYIVDESYNNNETYRAVEYVSAYVDDPNMSHTINATTVIAKVSVYSPVRELVVTDGVNLNATGTYTSATFEREFNTAYTYGTICLPFAPDAETCAKYNFYKLASDNQSTETLVFEEETEPKANVAYLYSPVDKAEAIHTFTGGATTISAVSPVVGGDWQFVGTFETLTEFDYTSAYYFAYLPNMNDGKDMLSRVSSGLQVSPYRAYFIYAPQAVTGSIAPLATMRIVVRGAGDNGDGTTGIEEVITPDQIEGAAPAIYNLMGQPVAQPVKGQIYIVNGQKVVY